MPTLILGNLNRDWSDWSADGYNRSPIRGSSCEYVVLSRAAAEAANHPAYEVPHALISIVDPGDGAPRLAASDRRVALLPLEFDDIAKYDPLLSDYLIFDESMADSVAEFVAALDPSLRLVVHCFAGISRSAGMVAGIADARGETPVVHAVLNRFLPNNLVFRLTSEAISRLS